MSHPRRQLIAIDARRSNLSQANFGHSEDSVCMNLNGVTLDGDTVLQISLALPASVPEPGALGLAAVALAAPVLQRLGGRGCHCPCMMTALARPSGWGGCGSNSRHFTPPLLQCAA